MFYHVLGYKCVEHSRNYNNPKTYDKYVLKGNESSCVTIINSEQSAIKTLKTGNDYLDYMFDLLYKKHGIDYKNSRIYFIWDRDNKPNPREITQELILKLNNSMESDGFDMQGLLLLSYPYIESYTISNFEDTANVSTNNLKEYIKEKKLSIEDISSDTLIQAAVCMHKSFIKFGVREYSVDNFKITNEEIFKKQEEIYDDSKKYRLLSLLSIMLVDLGIITERE